MDAVERVEIVRGPGSALYGTNAMFAVINVITKTGNSVDGLLASADMGNFGVRQGSFLYGREFASGLDISFAGEMRDRDGVDLYFPEYDDPATNNGIAENLDWDESVGAVGRVTYGPWSIQGVRTARRTGVATGSYETDFNDSRGQSLDKLNIQEIRFEQNAADRSQLMLRAAHKMYTYEGSWFYEGSNAPDEAATHSVVIEGQYRRDLSPTNRLIVGAEYVNHYESVYRYEDADFDQDRPYSVASAFVQNEHRPTPKVILSLGARLDRYSTVGNALTPRAAVVYHPLRSTSLKLLYGEAFRAPGMYEIHYTDQWYSANSDLETEKIRTSELVWEQQLTPRLTSTLSIYHYSLRQLIDQRRRRPTRCRGHRLEAETARSVAVRWRWGPGRPGIAPG
jgi:iron complex outermembrane receptor protein